MPLGPLGGELVLAHGAAVEVDLAAVGHVLGGDVAVEGPEQRGGAVSVLPRAPARKDGSFVTGGGHTVVSSSAGTYKANAGSLAIALPRAEFRSKATLLDITNPAKPVSVAGNLVMETALTDNGKDDAIGVTIWNGAKSGTARTSCSRRTGPARRRSRTRSPGVDRHPLTPLARGAASLLQCIRALI